MDSALRLSSDIDELLHWRPDVARAASAASSGAAEAVAALNALSSLGIDPCREEDEAREILSAGRPLGLPARLICFGLTAVPGGPGFSAHLAALARHAEVRVLIPCVRPTLATAERPPLGPQGQLSLDDLPLGEWFRESAEALALWRDVAPDATLWRVHESEISGDSSLHALQRRLAGHSRNSTVTLTGGVRAIGAAGIGRQAEILRDQLLDAVASGRTLQDVHVLSPKVDRIASALDRHWSLTEPGAPHVPFELTERDGSLEDRASALLDLLDLIGGRSTADDLLEYLANPVVQEALGLESGDSERLGRLAETAPITLGISTAQRAPFAVYPSSPQWRHDGGTWQRLSDRVAYATVYPEHDSNAAPLGVADDLDAVAALQPLLRLLENASTVCRSRRPLSEWFALLREWADVVAPAEGAAGSLERLWGAAQRWSTLELDPTVGWEDLRRLAVELLTPVRRPVTFGHGGVLVGATTALGFAPAPLICVPGLDDDALPPPSLLSPVLGDRRVGDPSPRHSALGALLATVACARDDLVITYTDRRVDTGQRLERPVPLDELIATVTASGGTVELLNSSRHGFVLDLDGDRMITETFDPVLSQEPLAPAPPPPPDARSDVDVVELTEFLRGPAAFYLRHRLGAELPTEADLERQPPAIRPSPRTRARLRRWYLGHLLDELIPKAASGEVIVYPGDDHQPGPWCEGEACASLHLVTGPLRQRFETDESLGAIVPLELWRHEFGYAHLELAACNAALDHLDLEPIDAAELREWFPDVGLGDGRTLRFERWRHGASRPRLYRDATGVAELTTWTLEPRRNETTGWRGLLEGAGQALALASVGLDAAVTADFLPERAVRYRRKEKNVAKDSFARNPRLVLRTRVDASAAALALARLAELLEDSRSAPPALFRRTSVAAVATSLRRDAAAEWMGSSEAEPGEHDEAAHRLLFPIDFAGLVELGKGRIPGADALAEALGALDVAWWSQTTRLPPRSAGGDTTPLEAFVPLVGEPL
jgi:hypothetical protein